MHLTKITLNLMGDSFSPKKLLSEIGNDAIVFESIEPDDANDKSETGVYGFGSLDLLSPMRYALHETLYSEYYPWYIDYVRRHIAQFRQQGVTEINLFIELFYNGTHQLNLEIFSKEHFAQIAQYGISLPLSVYIVSNEQLIDMMYEAGIPEADIQQQRDWAWVIKKPRCGRGF
ncbi:hypothetical protein AM493_13375 [Flavobacterium akiainvivens]|uniref:Uncharacterized protein n=1 Tax=Flavobacterium akiainvivens TaxID=1202724 RepID=A0A0M9VIQ1_9FLAO|nr:hypothetical protein [Flavobacterium akiainvivens]KOS06910.1 hypothetical protein AM493_13375 [Flavobacterium akiainvivens]SFQ69754.1 hypothetical protein SAMN05444144_11568 [Flavobacterium akiainvivens]